MNSMLVIFLTGMAVLGAYYLAELLSEGFEKPKQDEAILVLPGPVSPAQILEITLSVRLLLPRCQIVAGTGEQSPDLLLPTTGLHGVRVVGQEQLREELLRELDLQSGAKVL